MKMPTIIARSDQDDPPEKKDSITETVAAMIRERSAAAQLISEAEILSSLHDEHLLRVDADQADEDRTALLTRLIHENEDLHKIIGKGRPVITLPTI